MIKALEANTILPHNEDNNDRRSCFSQGGSDICHIRFMYVATGCYFLAVGLSALSLIFLVNERIAGDASEPNRQSIFVQTTVIFLNNASSLIFLRYNSGMGDFVGRKPMLVFSSFFMLVTRLLYTRAYEPVHFFVISILGGATESFYFSTLAWVCDIVPNHAERSRHYGILMGIAGLAGVVIGAPIGAALSIAVSHTAPFVVSAIFSIATIVVTICNPGCDTLTFDSMEAEEYRIITKHRALPKSMIHFLRTHFPISISSYRICMESKTPMDWLTFGITQWTWNILPLILVQFLLKVYDWSRAISSVCALSMGLSLGILIPILVHHIEPISLSFYSMAVQSVGFLLVSISGTGTDHFHKIGISGLVLVALGLSWLPCSHSIIMSGYSFGKQGVVSGLVGQLNDIAIFPSYLISLAFTFNLERGPGEVYWPGCAFGICSILLIFTMILHYRAHGANALALKHRRHFKDGDDVERPVKRIQMVAPEEAFEIEVKDNGDLTSSQSLSMDDCEECA